MKEVHTGSGVDHPMLSMLVSLLDLPAVSGHEHSIAGHIRALLDDWGYVPETDGTGNVLVRMEGRRPQLPTCCLAAHMDEIGMVVTAVEEDGRLRVTRSGGLFPWKLGEGPVEVRGDKSAIVGVLSMGSTHVQVSDRAPTWQDVWVLTGLPPADLAAAGVRPGSPATPIRSQRGPVLFGRAEDPLVAAWTFDDRMGVIMLLRLLRHLKEADLQPAHPTIVTFTTGEEIGGLGAKALAQRERPGIFIAVDGCPIPPGTPLILDGRPGIWTKDRLATYDPDLLRALFAAARAAGTELQPAVYTDTASDASLVASVGAAPRIACLGHVRENSHGYEVARLSVFDNVVETLLQFVQMG